ncbi:hypothetical protein [Bosea vaviloviae]|uniref:hypothetical protein n=1 Tax=Bosea vaviloviae TaxID=1526658 RepID=UPI0012E22517|nr:hypothetical protein [Bosea vaviloviae]
MPAPFRRSRTRCANLTEPEIRQGNQLLTVSSTEARSHEHVQNKVASCKTGLSPLSALGAAATATYSEINAASSPEQLDGIAARLWQRYGAGEIADHEAEFLTAAIEGRRPASGARAKAAGACLAPARLSARIGSRFVSRQRPRSPDRQASRDRRRRLGGSSALPDTLRHHYTEGQRAVLCIVAGEVKHHGACDLPIDKIAALAGVCRTTVQSALHEARLLGHVKITARPIAGRKNLPNIVEIVSPEWRTWIKRGPSAHRPIGSKPVNLESPTKSQGIKMSQVERNRSRSKGLARGGGGQSAAHAMGEVRHG